MPDAACLLLQPWQKTLHRLSPSGLIDIIVMVTLVSLNDAAF